MRHRFASLLPLLHGRDFLRDRSSRLVDVFHADSLGGPMRELKRAFEATQSRRHDQSHVGRLRELAGADRQGEVCDVFAPSSPAVIDQDLMNKKIAGTDRDAATWYVVFSANEMVVITAKGNPLGIKQVVDLARPDVKFVRVTGEKDLATGRTIEFVKRAPRQEGKPDLAQAIVDRAPVDPAKPTGVPDVVRAVREGSANAGIVYYRRRSPRATTSTRCAFRASVNMSEAIRNAATVPGTARNPTEATAFVAFLLSPEAPAHPAGHRPAAGRAAIRNGAVPAEIPLSASDSRYRQREAAFGGARPGMEVATASAN